ncbi:unnamed protein product [Mytilus edulis]|uniref:Uncharacterized protein n=1 Tax=Mytilus edulis TaxID=6550 RepID=A0A8S3SDA2_MYTED|nr:unnamed protein product [Mytilus edulis]
MCLHPELYKNRPDVNDIFILSPSYEESVLDCSRPAAYSSIWTMIAASDALGIAISSIYPAINDAFKKHVSWFSSSSDSKLPDIALYEYQGTYTINSNNKVRTHPNIIRQVQTEFTDKKPKEIFLQLNQDNSMTAPHDTKQIKNAKYRQKKTNKSSSSNNIADEILEVLSMLNDHPFVQQVIHKKGQVPSILCYTEETDDRHQDVSRQV